VTGVRLGGVGVVTGWGRGVDAWPDDAKLAAGDRAVVAAATPRLDGERFRRATRECLLGVAAVQASLDDAGISRDAVAGPRTALLYVTAAAYGSSNRAFIEAGVAGSVGALHFPYTAPCAVAAEVTIEYGLRGTYVTLIGGAAVTLEALAWAARLLAEGACDRVFVLAVETFAECADLFARDRRLLSRPLTEAAACALLMPGDRRIELGAAGHVSDLTARAERRVGETLACGPLLALALARATGDDPWTVTGRWRGRTTALAEA
jgi:3-oxoacyl-(acyl-carrier-protein) synthase